MKEELILRAFVNDRSAYEKYSGFIDKDKSPVMFSIILSYIESFYEKDMHAQSVDLDTIASKIEEDKYVQNKELVIEYLKELPGVVSTANLVDAVGAHFKDQIGTEIIAALNRKDSDDAVECMRKYMEADIEASQDDSLYMVSVEELEEAFEEENLIPIYPTIVSKHLNGGVPRQTQIGIVARPDVGKSTVSINMAVGACKNGYNVLYFGNEDPDKQMLLRILSRFTGLDRESLFANSEEAMEIALSNGYDKMRFVPLHPGSINEIRKYVMEYRPDMVILDQLRNIKIRTTSEGGMTETLNNASTRMRDIAKEFDLVSVLVTQAGDSAHNKLILDYTDVEYSNTGFAAQLDLMICVGQNENYKDLGRIMLSFPKNKLSPPIAPFPVNIDYVTNTVYANTA